MKWFVMGLWAVLLAQVAVGVKGDKVTLQEPWRDDDDPLADLFGTRQPPPPKFVSMLPSALAVGPLGGPEAARTRLTIRLTTRQETLGGNGATLFTTWHAVSWRRGRDGGVRIEQRGFSIALSVLVCACIMVALSVFAAVELTRIRTKWSKEDFWESSGASEEGYEYGKLYFDAKN